MRADQPGFIPRGERPSKRPVQLYRLLIPNLIFFIFCVFYSQSPIFIWSNTLSFIQCCLFCCCFDWTAGFWGPSLSTQFWRQLENSTPCAFVHCLTINIGLFCQLSPMPGGSLSSIRALWWQPSSWFFNSSEDELITMVIECFGLVITAPIAHYPNLFPRQAADPPVH